MKPDYMYSYIFLTTLTKPKGVLPKNKSHKKKIKTCKEDMGCRKEEFSRCPSFPFNDHFPIRYLIYCGLLSKYHLIHELMSCEVMYSEFRIIGDHGPKH